MSVSGFEQDYLLDHGTGPLHARPAGMLAATAIGGSALLILLVCLIFLKPKTESALAVAEASPQSAAAAELAAQSAPAQTIALDLAAPEFTKEKKTVATRKLEGAGGREDSLTLGQFGPSAPYLRVDIRQPAGEKRAAPDFFLDMTRHAAQAGLAVVKINPPSPFASRFGTFETAEIKLSQTANDGSPVERSCQALRLAGAKQGVEIAGIVCGAAAKPIDRRALPCIVDRLDYGANGENPTLDQFFRAAEQERGKACGGVAAAPGADSKADWLEAHSNVPGAKTESLPPKHTKKAR